MTWRLALALRDLDYKVTILGRSCGNEVTVVDGIATHSARSTRELRVCAKRMGRCDLGVSMSAWEPLLWIESDRAFVYHHNPYPIGDDGAWAVNRLRCPVVVPSKAAVRQQIRFGVDETLLHILPNVVEAPSMPTERVVRDSEAILFVGTLTSYKNVGLAIETVLRLQSTRPEARLHVIGLETPLLQPPGDELPKRGSGPFFYDWSRLASRGIVYHGELPHEKVIDWMRHSGILLSTSSVDETFGLALGEAQACGCIPVAPNRGAFPELVTPEQDGILYPPDATAEHLSEMLSALLRNDPLAEAIRRQCPRSAAQWSSSNYQAAVYLILGRLPCRAFPSVFRWRWTQMMERARAKAWRLKTKFRSLDMPRCCNQARHSTSDL